MPKPNISAAISQQDQQTIVTNLNAVKNLLPFLQNLTPKQRKALHKMGANSVSYVQLALTVAQQHPEILPPNFAASEFSKDVDLAEALLLIDTVLGPLCEGVSDTLTAVGSEAMSQADRVYELVKSGAKHDSNLKDIAAQLGERYKKQGRRKNSASQQKSQ